MRIWIISKFTIQYWSYLYTYSKNCCRFYLVISSFDEAWKLIKRVAHTQSWVNKTFQSEWESSVILTTKNGVTDHFGQITFCCHQLCVKNTFLSTQLFDLNRISREKIGSKPSCYRRGKKYYTTSPSLNMTI